MIDNDYMRERECVYVCVYSLENTRCIYRVFWTLDPCGKIGKVISSNISKIMTYLK